MSRPSLLMLSADILDDIRNTFTRRPVLAPATITRPPEKLYHIWSIEHGRWWGPNAVGYIEPQYPQLAGKYNLEEATQIVNSRNTWRNRAPEDAIVPV